MPDDEVFTLTVSSSGNIAKGVAYATCNHLTIHEFIQQGAGFGLQRKQVPNRGEPESDEGWEDEAPPIFSVVSICLHLGTCNLMTPIDQFARPVQTLSKSVPLAKMSSESSVIPIST